MSGVWHLSCVRSMIHVIVDTTNTCGYIQILQLLKVLPVSMCLVYNMCQCWHWHMWLHSYTLVTQSITRVYVLMSVFIWCLFFNYQLLMTKLVVGISPNSWFIMNVYVISIINFLILLIELRHRLRNCLESHTLQSNANLLASMMAAFLSRCDSKANMKDCPCFGCQNSACAAAFPPPRTPHS